MSSAFLISEKEELGWIKEATCNSPYTRTLDHPKHPLLVIVSPSIWTFLEPKERASNMLSLVFTCFISSIISLLWRLYFEHHTSVIFLSSRKANEKTERDTSYLASYVQYWYM